MTDSFGNLSWFGVVALASIPAGIIGGFLYWAASLIPAVQ
jgi:hypothetical protein